MPRSFLVKKVKLDDFSSADLENHYGRVRSDLSLRFHEKGKAVRISDFNVNMPTPSFIGIHNVYLILLGLLCVGYTKCLFVVYLRGDTLVAHRALLTRGHILFNTVTFCIFVDSAHFPRQGYFKCSTAEHTRLKPCWATSTHKCATDECARYCRLEYGVILYPFGSLVQAHCHSHTQRQKG